MNKITPKMYFTSERIQMFLLILCSLYIVDYAWGRPRQWDRKWIQVSKDINDNAILIKFKFFDYAFGPARENGYLEVCDFFYSTDGSEYLHFMRAETRDQKMTNWSWLNMRYKLYGAKIQFNECYVPANGTMWTDDEMQRVEVTHPGKEAFFSVKWFLSKTYQDVKYIKIVGQWNVNGFYANQPLRQYYEAKPTISNLNTELKIDSKQNNGFVPKANQSENNSVKVYSDADAIVIKGTAPGDNINIYKSSGELIQSLVVKNDNVKIKLRSNNIYVVHVGHARYKVAL